MRDNDAADQFGAVAVVLAVVLASGNRTTDERGQSDVRGKQEVVMMPGIARVVPQRQRVGVLAGDDPEPVMGKPAHDGLGLGVELPQCQDRTGEEAAGGLDPAILAELASGLAARSRQEGDDGLGRVGDGWRGGPVAGLVGVDAAVGIEHGVKFPG